jgi:hypothetical protein
MKPGSVHIKYFIIAALAIYAITITRQNKKNREEKSRVSENYKILQAEHGSTAQVQELLRKEFKKFYPYYDSLAKEKNIKTKKIENITNVYYKHIYDTIKIYDTNKVAVPGTQNRLIEMSFEENCLTGDALLDFRETSIYPTDNDVRAIDLSLANIEQTDSITTFYYWDRQVKKILFIKLKIGRKQFFSQSHSKCEAELKTESIDIIKKGKK